ncbi:FHA domain-containing protein [Anaeromyxobacter oryzae]|uniref:FHA domain-containing protein n=1 Tax=Anaeromyxobacter oryzae TaxID=2918170 RepID=A0ABN6MQ36_9BACT|nr:FHA domain-containing protein [Anaeromyxobacter oryzae]BDG01829.1 hypothetical protein AMOR_08250 [Anaeromyxobacter oryzae]
MKCRTCGAGLDLTMARCPACGVEAELGRLTGILGIVCRGCDAYNEPGASTCVGCGKPLGVAVDAASSAISPSTRPPPIATPTATPAPTAPALAGPARPSPPPPPVPGTPVVRSFPRGAPAATRLVPAAALRPTGPDAPALTPLPLGARCPRCGTEARAGAFCAHCGQALAPHGTQVMASARAEPAAAPTVAVLSPGRARLVVERGGGREGATFALDAERVETGRTSGSVVFPDDPCLAPHHATFLYRDGALHVRDEGAPGGTFLRLRGLSVSLRPGDHLAFGERLLRFVGPLPPPQAPAPDGTHRLGAPRPRGAAVVLEERLEGGGTGRVFVRGGPSVTIGRAGCAVNLGADPLLSQAHAEIVLDAAGGARLRDLGSSSGTFVRLPPRGERELRDGDAVRLGRQVLRVVVDP